MATDRANVAGYFGLDLDGVSAGIITKASGGLATADVIAENMGVTSYVPKHLGQIQYPDLSFSVGAGMSKGFYDWMKASFDAKYQRKNGAIVNCDFNYTETSRLTFYNALIKSVGFP